MSFRFLLLFFVFCTTDGRTWSNQDMVAAKSWQRLEVWVKEWVKDSSDSLRNALKDSEVSPECGRHVAVTLDGLDGMQYWAVKMLDSWAKLPSGYSSGVSGFTGDFDACLAVEHPEKQFRGKYCNVRTKPALPDFGKVHLWSVFAKFPDFAQMAFQNNTIMHNMVRDYIVWYYRYPYKIGVCIPSTCTPNDVQSMATQAIKSLQWNITISDCQMKEELQLTSLQVFTITCFAVLALVIILATYMDNQDSTTGWTSHFSFVRNWRALMDVPINNNKFNFLDGMRVILTFWTIAMHTCSMFEPTVLSGCYTSVYLVAYPLMQVIMNGWASVDSFFCITGFLLGYTLLRNLQRNEGKMNWIKFCFRRICRLSPTLWALLGVVYLTPLVGSGAHWPDVFGKDVERCHESWLPVVFFYNNWLRYDKMCLPMTWYLSVDVQLYFMGSIVVFLIYRWPRVGIKTCLLAVILPSLWLFHVVYVNDLQPSLIWESFDLEYRELMLRLTYLGSSAHLPPFLIGVLTGYLLDKFPKCTFGKRTLVLCWTASTVTFALVIFSGHPWHSGIWPTPAVSGLYQATHRIFWAVATGWMIYACATGNGGLYARALSWSGFVTLSRLSFLMGLLNIPVIRFKNSLLRSHMRLTLTELFYDFLGHYSISISLSVVLFLLVESPFASLSESYLRDGRKTKQN